MFKGPYQIPDGSGRLQVQQVKPMSRHAHDDHLPSTMTMAASEREGGRDV